MNVLKRSIVYIKANIGKSLLLFFIFFVTMSVVTTSLLISKLYDNGLNSVFAEGTVPVTVQEVHPDTMLEDLATIGQSYNRNKDFMTVDQIDDIGHFDMVKDYDMSMESDIGYGDLVKSDDIDTSSKLYLSYTDDFFDDEEGYTVDYDKDIFNNNEYSIILNEGLLDANNLEVGDTITLDLNSDYSKDTIDQLTNVELTIAGSYVFEPPQK